MSRYYTSGFVNASVNFDIFLVFRCDDRRNRLEWSLMPELPTLAETGTSADQDTISSIEHVLEAYRQLRVAVADLFHAVGTDATRTRETARALGLNRGLAWRLTRVVRSPESPAVISDVPGPQSIASFLKACRKHGAPEASLRAAQDAFAGYESAVDSCSGDRKTLAMLMANHADLGSSNEQERARRKLFEGACGIWGVQAQIRFVTVFVFPSTADADRLDAGHVTGFVGLRRLSARSWPLSYEAVHDKSGEAVKFAKEPLDPDGSSEGELQLIQRFCSPPRPKVVVRQIGAYKRFELASGPVGNEGLTTCVFGSLLKGLYPRYSETPDTAGFMVLLQTPIERVMFDIFVHRDLGVPRPPLAQLLDRLTFPHGNEESDFERQELPIRERPLGLPGGAAGAMCPHIPWYGKLLTFVSERIGRPLESFEGSRFEMTYPPISTTLSRRFDLLPKPD